MKRYSSPRSSPRIETALSGLRCDLEWELRKIAREVLRKTYIGHDHIDRQAALIRHGWHWQVPSKLIELRNFFGLLNSSLEF